MKKFAEFAGYVSISAGLALAASSFTMLAALLGTTTPGWALGAIPLAGLLLLVVAGSIGSLASMFPSAPGLSVYLGKAFGGPTALVVVFMYLSIFGCLVGGESYVVAAVLRRMGAEWPAAAIATVVLGLVTLTHLAGLEVPRKVQIFTTFIVVGTVFALSALALLRGHALPTTASVHASSTGSDVGASAATAVGMGVFLFLGFEWVTPLGRSPKHYARMIPWAMPTAIGLLTLIYSAFSLALVRHFPREVIAGTPIPQFLLASVLGTPLGTALAVTMSVFAMANTFNAGLLGAARLLYGLSREGSLPRFFSRIWFRTGAPVVAILITSACALVAAIIICEFNLTVPAVAYAAALECFIYGAVTWAWWRLDKTSQKKPSFRSPFPRALQAVAGCVMPVLGVGALFADAAHWPQVMAFFAVSMTLIVGTAFSLYLRRTASENYPIVGASKVKISGAS